MTKNTIGGKRFKKGKKTGSIVKRQFPKKSDFNNSQEQFFYGKVVNVLGGKNVLVLDLENNMEIIGIICGNMYKKEWLKKDDVLLCSKRTELSNNKCDIIFKYNNDEVKILKRLSEIQYHEKIKNNILDNIFNVSDDSSDEDNTNTNALVEKQPEYDLPSDNSDFGESDIDEI